MKDSGELYALEEHHEENLHKEKSLTSPVTLEDIFSVKNDNDISKDIDEAGVHIIKHKLAKFTLTAL